MTFAYSFRFALPVGLLATGACFATRSDMRVLQGDILTMRQEAARADTSRARQLGVVAATMGVVADSLRATSSRLASYQGENRGEFRAIGQQVLQLQELVGQSQVALGRLRAENEARLQQQLQQQQQAAPQNPPIATDTVGVPVVPPAPVPVNPGPNQLLNDGLAQARRGSYGTAQAAFEELIRLYPNSDLAPEGQYYLGEAYASDGKTAQADSAFEGVIAKYPKAPKASTALYKLALSLARQGRKADARARMDQVVRVYPASDDAVLAGEWLRANR